MAKSKLDPHVQYVDECLKLLKSRLDEVKSYLNETNWREAKNREEEFKFQASLLDKYVAWLNEYSNISDMTKTLKDLTGSDSKEVRKNSYRSDYAEMMKEGKI